MTKALIVEDEAFVALDLQEILQKLGYEVIGIAQSGENALDMVQSTPPDLMLVDVSLAGELTGIEMVQQIRAEHDMPVIYITAYSDDATIEPMKQTEPFEYMLKPFNEQVLRVTIELALHKAVVRKEQIASERLLTTTLQSIGDAVITTDQHGTVQFMNAIAEKLTGWMLEEAQNKPLTTVLHIINEQSRKPAFDPVRAVLETGKSSHLANNTLLISADGTEYPIEDSAAPIVDEDETIFGVVLVFRDITQRHQSELWLRQAQKLDSLGLLAGGIAHDFNNILGTITVNASMLRTRELQSPDNVRIIDRIQHASGQAAALTDQLLSYAGGQPIDAVVIDLNHIVASALELVSPSQPDHVSIEMDLWATPLWILAERTQIQQVLLNLILNAYDAMRDNGDDARLLIQSKRVHLTPKSLGMYLSKSGLEEGDYAQIVIQDTGSGIEPAVLEKMFDPFYSTKPTGKGLGLAATLGIIYQQEGGIRVISSVGEGTTFTCIIPYQTDTIAAGRKDTLRSDPHIDIESGNDDTNERGSTSKRNFVLIADDQSGILDSLGEIIRVLGYEALLASDGPEAVALYAEHMQAIKFVILDIRMPTMNGTDALMAMYQHDPQLKAILMTGHADLTILKSYQEHFADVPILRKPFSYDQVVDEIQSLEIQK